jgi:hypothetical protein
VHVAPARAGEILIWKVSMTMNVAPGDVFLDVGVAHQVGGLAIEPLDRRCSAIHLKVLSATEFDGPANLQGAASLVARLR